MITQACYWSLNGAPNVWCTTASDKHYSFSSRLTLRTKVKPTARQVRRLMKLSKTRPLKFGYLQGI